MKNILLLLAICLPMLASAQPAGSEHPVVILHTSKGAITLELFPDQAPVTVANFLEYARSGFYTGTIFHRVIKRFMIQGGGFTRDLNKKATRDPIVNESGNNLNNDRYTIAMARTDDPDSATSQFFINTKINATLDAQKGAPGYTVFGIVIDGQYVVKAIEKSPTQRLGTFTHLPVEPIIIERVEIKTPAE